MNIRIINIIIHDDDHGHGHGHDMNHGATSIGTSDLYRIIGSYANQSADIADPVEPIERSSSLRGNLVTERFI